MKLKQLSLKQSLNDAYRLVKPERAEIEKFKANFKLLRSHINLKESEENMKGHVMDFLKNTYYNPNYHIATKGRTDFVIHTGKDATQPVGVLFEVKKPSNAEMVTAENLNTKALHEIILYYLRERIEHGNNNITQIVITNIYEWFIFRSSVFEKLFFENKALIKDYKAWMAKQKVSNNNDLFYNEIAKPFVAALTDEIEFTRFDIREFEKPLRDNNKENDNKLIPLFKIFSPVHLLKLPFANDSNSLNKSFYTELLYLIGLEEVKDGSKKVIRRRQATKRNDGSLLENTIIILETENCLHKVPDLQQYGENKDDQLFSVALELCITWINRILFLKLLEAQLLKYHRANNDYKFLNYRVIPQYDELYKLFFQVLAKKHEERIAKVKEKYDHIPYLNSSLFEITTLEDATIRINMLDDAAELPLLSNTILKDGHNKPVAEKLNTLHYIFEFLNAYDFASEGSEEIQEERKTLINASVLGLIFEKINGYKDGSIFTPGFITMYMCRQSIRQAVLNKFKEKYGWKADAFEDLHNYVIEDRTSKTIKQYNALINSLTICDPAVGSGHFLVSALNELIAIKSELGILADENGKRLSDHTARVENDELVIKDNAGNFFTYNIITTNNKLSIPNAEMQRVQTTLFHEKQTIIENCLFGVDINPKSVQICRLRLWIELLKNAYYIDSSAGAVSELQTLPNIDINIKTGNSLISRFALDEDLKAVFKQGKYSIETYKIVVQTYKDSRSKEEKAQLQNFVKELKEQFKTVVYRKDPLRNKLQQLRGDLLLLTTMNTDLFGKKLNDKDVELESRRLELSITQTEKELEEKENSKIYNNAFEWRFEFPEVLDKEGNFIGFDVVIGNPPYIRQEEISYIKNYLAENYEVFSGTADLLVYFIEKGISILKQEGEFNVIIANKFMRAGFGKPLRNFLQKFQLKALIDFGDLPVFDEATTYPVIMHLQKKVCAENFISANVKELEKNNFEKYLDKIKFKVNPKALNKDGWNLAPEKFYSLLQKLKTNTILLDKYIQGNNYYGIKTGLNEAFVIDTKTKEQLINEDANSRRIIKPFLIGKDIKRYTNPDIKHWLIAVPKGFTIKRNLPPSDSNYLNEPTPRYGNMPAESAWDWFKNNYPAVAKYLFPFKEKALARGDKGDFWWELRACDYYNEFSKPKIIYPNICRRPEFIWDENGYYTNQKCFIITDADKYLLGVLNSHLTYYLFKQILPKLRGDFYEPSYAYFKNFPIADANENERKNIEGVVDKILVAKKQNPKANTSQLENEIDKLVYKLYNLTPDEIKIIEESVK